MSASPLPLILHANRRALSCTAIAVVSLAVLSALFLGLSFGHDQPRFADLLVGSLLTLYSGSLSLYYVTYLLCHRRKRPVLVADERGLLDETAFSGRGFIPWSAIACVQNCHLDLKSGGREPAVGIALTTLPRPRRSPWQRSRHWAIKLWFRWPHQPLPLVILYRDLALPPNFDLAAAIGDRRPPATPDPPVPSAARRISP